MVLSGFLLQLARVVCVVSLAFACARAAEPEQIAGTMPEDYFPQLKEILASAVQRAPEVVVRDFDRETNQARLLEANATRLPRFGGNFNYASNETSTTAESSSKTRDNGLFYNFGLGQEVFHWGALKNARAAARLNLLVAEKQYALAYRQLCVSLRQLYLALIVEKAALRERRVALDQVRRDIKVLQVRFEQGAISAAYLEGEKFRERELNLLLRRAEENFGTNRRRLARVAGLSETVITEESIPGEIPRPQFSEALTAAIAGLFLSEGGKGSLEWEVYDARLREAVLQQKIQNVRLLPKIGANIGYSLENTTNVNPAGAVEQKAVARQSISIGGSWDIFDGFRTRAGKQQALINKRSIEFRMKQDLEELMQRVQQLERTLRLDAEQLDLSDIRRSMAVMVRDRAKEEAGRGNVAPAEIDRAENGILQADARSMESRAAFLSNWSDFVATAADDPMLKNLPVRYDRAKK